MYVFIPLSLTDPLLEDAVRRVATFEEATYYDNGHALQCHYASLGLALRGRSVDRATFQDGPGGVGQSLNTHRVAAALGPKNHSYLDMNIYYSDDELRKQAETISNSFVHTGQESPDLGKAMREDLLNKTCHG